MVSVLVFIVFQHNFLERETHKHFASLFSLLGRIETMQTYAVVKADDDNVADFADDRRQSEGVELTQLEGGVGRLTRAPTFSPHIPDNAPTVLTFSNITVTTKNAKKSVLLDDCSGSITGGFWAVMGASGGGKTTLLSTLSLRLDAHYMDITGEFRLNGREYSRSVLKEMSAYVMQDDLLHSELTVYETLWYAAQLRMRADTNEERLKRIDEVLGLMGIGHCRDVIIGDTRKKGISGGERKRVSVAIELLNHPKLLFLDEPTSGLDSTTAFSVAKALKHLAAIGECTVLCTIHQPMPKIFRLFDNLILMKKGKIVYQGQAMKSILWLEVIGAPCPRNVNLADHLLNVISPNSADHAEKLDESTVMAHVPVDLFLGECFFSHAKISFVISCF
jgi:ABC-type multidrug transport system ATPase subunit